MITPDSITATTASLLLTALTETLPYCSGTLALQPRDAVMYYGKKENAE